MDLKKHRVLIASFVLVALVATLAILDRRRSAEYQAGAEGEESPLPTLVRDQITSVEITRPGSEPIRLEKRGNAFVVAAPIEYPADPSNVNSMLDKLVELEFVSYASRSRGSHAQLEVDDAHAIRVVVKAGNRELAKLRIGVYRGSNTMIRLGESNDVLAIRGSIRYAFSRDLREWRNRVITEIAPSDVRAVSFASDQGNFRFERNASGDFAPAAGQAAITGFDASRVDSLVASLSRLRATDFGSANDATTAFATPRGVVTLHVESAADGDAGVRRAEDIVLTLGAAHGDAGDAFVRRSGNDTAYVIASASADKLRPAAAAFQPPPPGAAPAAPDPHAMGMGGEGGGQQIPPEVLRQLMQQAGAHP